MHEPRVRFTAATVVLSVCADRSPAFARTNRDGLATRNIPEAPSLLHCSNNLFASPLLDIILNLDFHATHLDQSFRHHHQLNWDVRNTPDLQHTMAQTVVLVTTMGEFTLELYTEHAPKVSLCPPILLPSASLTPLFTLQTCHNFSTLASRGYYNTTPFHRIIPSFMIQGGDPTGTGRGGASIYGDKFDDEINPSLRHTGAGILSMANSGPNTNGSQFFITLAPTPWLDGKHTIFGRVKGGMKVVQRMGLVKVDKDDRPVEAVRVLSARVEE